jgi:DNA-binding NarL/FixJ family response regulator
MTEVKKIIIVDDHQLVIDGLVNLINIREERFKILTTYSNPLEALQKVPILKPDILMVDLDMPQLSGAELIARLKPQMPELKIMLLTMHLDRVTVQKMMKLEVDAYLLKSGDQKEFLLGLESVASGHRYFSNEVNDVLIQRGKSLNGGSTLKTLMLTKREREVLKLIAEGLSTRDMSEQLIISTGTVETHRKSLLKKLEVNNVAGLVRIAVKEGLI